MKKKNSGRRGKFVEWLKSEGLIKIEGWARDGLTDEQIAANIGISRSTLNEWKKKYSDISDTLKRGKEVVDRQVENALLKRALGYQYNEVTQEKTWSDDLGIYEMSVTKIVIKEVNPDVTAQIFWLKNRKPKDWRDKQDIQHSGNVEINNPMKDLTAEELRKLINK
ncbi:helix-turn-helix domain-containing protein [Sporosarcina psychrophila]|uniref:helix-turn-helix domain-containing protein n=1 Tax=Sporosarcina psychrophila TaxID=1476 RepID=UPI0033924A68